jgi:hypothetical protein
LDVPGIIASKSGFKIAIGERELDSDGNYVITNPIA